MQHLHQHWFPLQLSLLIPYVQQLGIPHQWASIIWLCGPVSGLFVQPLVGHMSDRCTSRFGRRRSFIFCGAVAIIIGFAAGIGWLLGVTNNVTQGPCRALLADLTSKDPQRTRVANAYYSLFMAVGNILGYATGSYSGWFKIFSFTLSPACTISCANLKSAFFLDIAFIAVTTHISIMAAHEVPLDSNEVAHAGAGAEYADKDLPPPGIVIAALIIFTILGFPLAITYSVPYALVSTHIESLGLGQGLSMRVLNLAIVVPQIIVSLGSGPWDQLFGGGNSPAFAVGAVSTIISGLIAILAIPRSGNSILSPDIKSGTLIPSPDIKSGTLTPGPDIKPGTPTLSPDIKPGNSILSPNTESDTSTLSPDVKPGTSLFSYPHIFKKKSIYNQIKFRTT